VSKTFRFASVIAGFTALVALVATAALAQSKAAVGGMVALKLTDPAGGEPWRVQRRLLRTFSTTQECENRKESFISFHVSQVQRHGLMSASGTPPVIEVESIECFTVRLPSYRPGEIPRDPFETPEKARDSAALGGEEAAALKG
jgi:hypothetical protein